MSKYVYAILYDSGDGTSCAGVYSTFKAAQKEADRLDEEHLKEYGNMEYHTGNVVSPCKIVYK